MTSVIVASPEGADDNFPRRQWSDRFSRTQSHIPMLARQLNHVALHVADVDASVAFYRDTMRLPVMDRPAFDFPGAWFRLGEDQELHLIGDRDQPVHSHHRGGHFALVVDSLQEWESHLDASGATRLARKTRPDGAHQTFVQDPDGHWIELCVPASDISA